MASDLNESMSAVKTVFGGAAGDVSGFSGSVAKSLGLSRQEALQVATTFGAMGQQIGLTGKPLSDFSNNMLQAGADLASFYNAPVPEALDAIQSGLQGETEPLRRFGIFLSDAELNAYAMAKGIGKTTQEMTEQEKVSLRQQYILDHLGKAQGDFARTSGGLANQMRILRAQMMDVGAQFGAILLPYALKAVEVFRSLAERFAALSPHAQKIIVVVLGIAAAIGPLLLIFGQLAGAISAIIAIAPLLGTALTVALGPVGIAIVAIAAAVALFAIAYKKNWLGIGTLTRKVVADVVKALKTLQAILGGGRGLHDAIKGLPEPLQKAAIALRRLVVIADDLVHLRFDQLGRDFELLGRTIGNFFASIGLGHFGDDIKRVVADVVAVVTDVVHLVDDLIHGRWSAAWQDFQKLAVDYVRLVIDYLEGLPALLADIFGRALDAIRAVDWGAVGSFLLDKGRQLIQGLYDGALGLLTGTVLPWLGGLAADLLAATPDLLGTLFAKGEDLLRGLWRGISGFWDDTVKPWLANLADHVLQNVPGMLGTLKSAGGELLTGLWIGAKAVWDTAVVPFFSTIGNAIGAITPAGTVLAKALVSAGSSVIEGFKSGVDTAWTAVSDFFSGIAETIAGLIPTDWSGVEAAFKPLTDIIGTITGGFGRIKEFLGGGDGDNGQQQPAGSQAGGTPIPATAQTIPIDADISAFNKKMQSVSESLLGLTTGEWTAKLTAQDTGETGLFSVAKADLQYLKDHLVQTFTATLDANPAPFDKKLWNAIQAGLGFKATTFTTTLDANRAPFDGKLWNVIQAGLGLAATTFTATLAANAGPAISSLLGIEGSLLAYAFSRYTATLYLDTGPAVSALNALAAMLPHSPAKTGPFRRPANFDTVMVSPFVAAVKRMTSRLAALDMRPPTLSPSTGALPPAAQRALADTVGVAWRGDGGGGAGYGPTYVYGPTYNEISDPQELWRVRRSQDVGLSRR
jgi:hypothetical protein